jgi:hypothetical protein
MFNITSTKPCLYGEVLEPFKERDIVAPIKVFGIILLINKTYHGKSDTSISSMLCLILLSARWHFYAFLFRGFTRKIGSNVQIKLLQFLHNNNNNNNTPLP